MEENKKIVKKDATGYEILTVACRNLLNQFPGLYQDETVKFEELEAESGIAFSNNNGALVISEKKDITGTVTQTCNYPFFIVYRTSGTSKETYKMSVAEFLELFGKWVCGETVEIDGKSYRLTSRPKLSQGRKIVNITRDNCYGLTPQENGVQDWLLPVSIEYTNEFEQW